MPNHYEDVERGLLGISNALGLVFEKQDWGIINADGNRLEEFILFYEAHQDYSFAQKFELFELIMASANERLCDQGGIGEEFGEFLSKNRDSFETQVDYWRKLDDIMQFPLGEYLRKQHP